LKISLIAAFAEERVIGKDGKIPWTLKEDLKHFRNKTEGFSVVMGRKTYESIGVPLPNRLNIVMTRNPKKLEGVKEVTNKEKALEIASSYSNEVFIIGGEKIYEEFLPLATKMYLTKIDIKTKGDAFFPKWNVNDWEELSRQDKQDRNQNIKYCFLEYKRK
jgi:dihydrofolate reductase